MEECECGIPLVCIDCDHECECDCPDWRAVATKVLEHLETAELPLLNPTHRKWERLQAKALLRRLL